MMKIKVNYRKLAQYTDEEKYGLFVERKISVPKVKSPKAYNRAKVKREKLDY